MPTTVSGHIRVVRQVLSNVKLVFDYGSFRQVRDYNGNLVGGDADTTIGLYALEGDYVLVYNIDRPISRVTQTCEFFEEPGRLHVGSAYLSYAFGQKDACFGGWGKDLASGKGQYLAMTLTDDFHTTLLYLKFVRNRGQPPLQPVEGAVGDRPVGSLASQLARGELWVRVRGVADLGGGRWLRALRVWSTCNATWQIVDSGGRLVASSSDPLEVRWAGGGDSEVVAVRWGQANKCTVYIEVPDSLLSRSEGASPFSANSPPPRSSLRIAVEYTESASSAAPVLEPAKWGYWEIGARYTGGLYEFNVASFSQPVSIPLTFYVRREYANRPVCVRARGGVLLTGDRKIVIGSGGGPPLQRQYSPREEVFELGRPPGGSTARLGNEVLYVLKGSVTVSLTDLLGGEPETGAGAVLLTWVDCSTKEPLSNEVGVELKTRQGTNTIAPPRAVRVDVGPQSGDYRVSQLPDGVFTITVRASEEVELSFVLGLGRTFDEAMKVATEVDLVDRQGKRYKKVVARELKINLKLPRQLLAPVVVVFRPKTTAPLNISVWRFT
ncbi:MAG: hypothetical protein ACPL3C_03365 [Pyrobaculum sp.]